jgi:ubiquitin-like 1-activating enzyme E1 A
LVGLKGLGSEVAKNLVLAGIGSLTIVDDEAVTEDDPGAQFFISEEHVGINVSSSAIDPVNFFSSIRLLTACQAC